MGACHQIIEPLANNGGWLWTKAVLQRSLKVNGDCMPMLGDVRWCAEGVSRERSVDFAGANGRVCGDE
jgi:hypothetical protein